MPMYMNPADFALDFIDTNFAKDGEKIGKQPDIVHSSWHRSEWAGWERTNVRRSGRDELDGLV